MQHFLQLVRNIRSIFKSIYTFFACFLLIRPSDLNRIGHSLLRDCSIPELLAPFTRTDIKLAQNLNNPPPKKMQMVNYFILNSHRRKKFLAKLLTPLMYILPANIINIINDHILALFFELLPISKYSINLCPSSWGKPKIFIPTKMKLN